jgi:hypothetical protein
MGRSDKGGHESEASQSKPRREIELETAARPPAWKILLAIRHYLLCLGIDVSGDTRRRPRGATIPVGRHSLFRGGHRSLWLNAVEGRAIS